MKPKRFDVAVNSFSYPLPKSEIIHELRVIATRERKSFSELLVEIIEEYVKSHAEGNSSFKIDTWIDNSEFKAIPTLLSPRDKWETYISECNTEERTKIAIMSNFISNTINKHRNHEVNQQMKNNKESQIKEYYRKQGIDY